MTVCRALAAVALVLGAAGTAEAQDSPSVGEPIDRSAQDERARVLYENGRILYDEGRYEDAVAAWEESYKLSGRPLLLYNLAGAYERVGRFKRALDYLNRYRAFAPPDERETLDRRVANLERRLAEGGDAPISASSTSDAQSPARPAEQQPAPASSSSSSSSSAGASEPVAARPFPVLPVALFGTGAVSVGAGLLFAVRSSSAATDTVALCASAGGRLLCPDDAADALHRNRTSAWLADGSFALGALALAGGAWTASRLHAGVVPRPGGLSVELSSEF